MRKSIQGMQYKKYIVDSRLRYFKPHATTIEKSFSEEIRSSLSKTPKSINPKFFYDNEGSNLFEQICVLPEYYLTRTEESILKNIKTDLANFLDGSFRLVELGSGSSTKTRLILDVFDQIQNTVEYFPIDISEILTESSEVLLKDYPSLIITGIIDTYEGGLEFIEQLDDKKNLIIFLGSSFGNFSPIVGQEFLQRINSLMKKNDLFLIGLDLVKDKRILEKAYNDSGGLTARFNLNVLSRINDELDADFDLDNFKHHALFNGEKKRIEMYLKSLANQSVTIGESNFSINIKKGELILTEFSHKYTVPQIQDLMKKTGFEIEKIWFDENQYFSEILLSKKS